MCVCVSLSLSLSHTHTHTHLSITIHWKDMYIYVDGASCDLVSSHYVFLYTLRIQSLSPLQFMYVHGFPNGMKNDFFPILNMYFKVPTNRTSRKILCKPTQDYDLNLGRSMRWNNKEKHISHPQGWYFNSTMKSTIDIVCETMLEVHRNLLQPYTPRFIKFLCTMNLHLWWSMLSTIEYYTTK